jgi:DNA-binding CsgD family transcriptional regulator
LTDCNEAASTLCGMGPEALRGRTLFELVPPEAVRRMNDLWLQLRTRGECVGEIEIASASGDRDLFDLRATADFMPGRQVVVLSSPTLAANSDRAHGRGSLTAREQEVFRLLALGFTGPEIAKRLFLSPHTVRRHVEKGIGVSRRRTASTRSRSLSVAAR